MTTRITTNPFPEEKKGTVRKRFKKYIKSTFSVETVKSRLPITRWITSYTFAKLTQDIIAGITVGLTAIPQGIAYAVVAGLSPEYGLYAGLMGGFVYLVFGGTVAVTIGPTAIMSVMVTNYVVNYSDDFAVLASFLAGVIILVMGVLNLGFLVAFVSAPVITGFTVAGALQIASGQLRSLFGLDGPSGSIFAESVYYFFLNIRTVRLWETLFGLSTIAMIMALKEMGKGCKRTDGFWKQLRWYISLGRNAVVVVIGIIVAYVIKVTTGDEPLSLVGSIGRGLPAFTWPPFTTLVNDQPYSFWDMLRVFGPQAIVIPLVSIIDTIAISKAFARGVLVDAKQEMIALGLCNIIGSFVRSMPTTASFTRTALNDSSGVQTQAGGIFTGCLIILALSLLTPTFYYIPRVTLAGIIMTAMFSMIDYPAFPRLWRTSKRELLVLNLTILVSMFFGLEFGILSGILIEAVMLLYGDSKPKVETCAMKLEDNNDIIIVKLSDKVAYCSAEHVRKVIIKASFVCNSLIVLDGSNLTSMDSTVASNILITAADLERVERKIIFFNFKPSIKKTCLELDPKLVDSFISGEKVEDCLVTIPNNITKLEIELEK